MDNDPPRREGPSAVRLTFAYGDEELRLTKARRLSMRAPAGERSEREAEERDERLGSWVEVRNANGEVVYRRRVGHVVPEDVEVYEGGEEGTFKRVPRGESSGVVNVLIPDVAGAETAVIRERRPADGTDGRPEVVEHASVSLDRLDERDESDADDESDDTPDESGSEGAR